MKMCWLPKHLIKKKKKHNMAYELFCSLCIQYKEVWSYRLWYVIQSQQIIISCQLHSLLYIQPMHVAGIFSNDGVDVAAVWVDFEILCWTSWGWFRQRGCWSSSKNLMMMWDFNSSLCEFSSLQCFVQLLLEIFLFSELDLQKGKIWID